MPDAALVKYSSLVPKGKVLDIGVGTALVPLKAKNYNVDVVSDGGLGREVIPFFVSTRRAGCFLIASLVY